MNQLERVNKDCKVVWENIRESFDGYITCDNKLYCYLTKLENGRIGVYWPKWYYLSVCYLYQQDDGEWEENTNEEECYYPGFNGDGSWSDYDWYDHLKHIDEGVRVQVHTRRYASVEIDEDGDMDFETWDNGESCVYSDVIKVNGKVVNYEEE